jgi:hypothetical protein
MKRLAKKNDYDRSGIFIMFHFISFTLNYSFKVVLLKTSPILSFSYEILVL